jgi:UDPglucose 6-dehydrogenase
VAVRVRRSSRIQTIYKFRPLDYYGQTQLEGASVTVYDPRAMENPRKLFPTLDYTNGMGEPCDGADVTLVLTEWEEICRFEAAYLDPIGHCRRVIDGRNCLYPAKWRNAG